MMIFQSPLQTDLLIPLHLEVQEVEEAVADFDADAEACCNPERRFRVHQTSERWFL